MAKSLPGAPKRCCIERVSPQSSTSAGGPVAADTALTTAAVSPAKPRLNFWRIWNMSFGFMGIQIGFALQNSNVSRIFQTLGAREDALPALWLAAPVTGLLVQPIIGHLSDRTWGRLGRRRPYFLSGAILASCGLLIMPNSTALWIAAGTLWLLDASINISMEPFRALVADVLPSEQRTMGFALQSFFIGVGAVIGSYLPWVLNNWFHISNTAEAGKIPDSLRFSFYIGALLFILAILWTVAKTKEYPPEDLNAFEKRKEETRGIGHGASEVLRNLAHMPKTMIQLAVVQFFTWFALFAMWIYTTSAVTSHVFKTSDTTSPLYNQGADWVGVMFGTYNVFSAVAAFLLPPLSRKTSRKTVHAISLACGGVGLASLLVVHDYHYLLLSMLGVGLAWASILSMPYAILAGALPKENVGVYMGIFNFFIVIPQIVAAGLLGFCMKTFLGGHAINAIVLGGASMILAAGLVLFVSDEDDPHHA
jgi:maltose/moltooligosaccharide transporter